MRDFVCRTLLIIGALPAIVGISSGQCVTKYSNASPSGATLAAVVTITDNYMESPSCTPCGPGGCHYPSFYHTHSAKITLTDPLGKSQAVSGSNQTQNTGGSITIDDYLPIDVDGTYLMYEYESVNCTIAGLIFYNAVTSKFGRTSGYLNYIENGPPVYADGIWAQAYVLDCAVGYTSTCASAYPGEEAFSSSNPPGFETYFVSLVTTWTIFGKKVCSPFGTGEMTATPVACNG